jgi:hypothetical protein
MHLYRLLVESPLSVPYRLYLNVNVISTKQLNVIQPAVTISIEFHPCSARKLDVYFNFFSKCMFSICCRFIKHDIYLQLCRNIFNTLLYIS